MKVVGIIQARMRSTRLPGKVLKDLCGRTVLAHGIARLQATPRVDQVVVATTELPVDDPVAAEAAHGGVQVFRGSEDDVLSRYCLAARKFDADVIVRMTSDCPLFDPELLDEMLGEFLTALGTDHPWDYFSNTLERRTYPTGLDAEIFTREALERAHAEAEQPHEREHVTPYLYQNPDLFRLGGLTGDEDLSRHRWTLDTPEDFALISRIYEELYRPGELFLRREILAAFDRHPEWEAINRQVAAKPLDPTKLGPLVIRADASDTIGAGHVMRCLALAQQWPPEAGPVVFAMAEGADSFGPRLVDEGFSVEKIAAAIGTPGDAEKTRELLRRQEAGWLVVDGYRFGADFLAAVGQDPAHVLLLDDEGRSALPGVSAVLNQNLHAEAALYPAQGPELLLGLSHVLLRREFLAASPRPSPFPSQAQKVLVTLGGGDPHNVTGRIVKALDRGAGRPLHIRALIGPGNVHRDQLQDMAREAASQLEILTGVKDMPGQYGWADLAITGGGGSLWELACCGLPALTLILADNQEPSSLLLDQAGVVRCLGRVENLQDDVLVKEFARLAGTPDLREEMSRRGRALIDGRGAERVLAALGRIAARPKEGSR